MLLRGAAGYRQRMTDQNESPKDVVHAIEHPIETVEEIVAEVDEGRSPWTPFMALSGITVIVFVIVAVVLALAFLAYFLA
jgi:hypothetical protein